jgi:hypothetical protein
MTLIHAIFDNLKFHFRSSDPIKTFYVKTTKELIPNGNYYIFLHIGDQIISFTNQFKKVIVDGIELYERDFCAKKWTIPMNLITHHESGKMSIVGRTYPFIEEVGCITIERLASGNKRYANRII